MGEFRHAIIKLIYCCLIAPWSAAEALIFADGCDPILAPEAAPEWAHLPGEANPFCVTAPGSICINASHILHSPGSSHGCTNAFSYNILHKDLSEAACVDGRFRQAAEVHQRRPRPSSQEGSVPPFAFLFDTGVDRAVHGHFMSKLMQLWSLVHAGNYLECICLL